MLREMEFALKVTRGYYREYFPPVEIFKMATLNAAKALGLNIGTIEEGRAINKLPQDGTPGADVGWTGAKLESAFRCKNPVESP